MLWKQGYSAVDIITTLFRVVKFYEGMPEYMKLDYIKVSTREQFLFVALVRLRSA